MGAAGGDIAAACCTITVAVAEAEAAGAEATITFVRFFAAHGAHGSTGSPIAGSRYFPEFSVGICWALAAAQSRATSIATVVFFMWLPEW